MTERPILFSGDMVRAILSGAKTQTRRPVVLEDFKLRDCPKYGQANRPGGIPAPTHPPLEMP